MVAMKKRYMLVVAVLLAGCAGCDSDSGASSTDNTGDPSLSDRYTTSQPLVDNSGADAYRVLLMGNSHAAGLSSVLAELLALGQPGKSTDVRLV